MKKNKSVKIFYIHTPKTGGTSVNKYFSKIFPNTTFLHVEAHIKKDPVFDLNNYEFISGHLSFPAVRSLTDASWKKMVTFREPYSFVISHLCWIRRLADSDQIENYRKHPANIQKIAVKMKEFDFSTAGDISRFVIWLDELGFSYLHNTQTIFMSPQKKIERALLNLEGIEFVGTLERLDEFLAYVNYKLSLGHTFRGAPTANVNSRNFGFNINHPETRKALYPLIDKDLVLYEAASKRLDTDLTSCKGVDFDSVSRKKTASFHKFKLIKKLKKFQFF